ncbi:MAG: NAD-dependent epimerase/dehydratase family protein, partial [Candidatus Hydrothermarchaeaceae archaeon]
MKIMILGIDGYIGWALAMHLANRGHEVSGLDAFKRRDWVREVGSNSAIPIEHLAVRTYKFKETTGKEIVWYSCDISKEPERLEYLIKKHQPECVVHLAEQPSAPFSMKSRKHSVLTQRNNDLGTLNLIHAIRNNAPDCHILKLGTMGEYGTPDIDIEEGFLEIEHKGRKDTVPYPKQPGSFYHASKCHDTINMILACNIWGQRSTDIMQGVVYGTRTDDMVISELRTRFDYDDYFGTCINRFCAQAVKGFTLTPYGKGGQTRGYIALRDSVQCLTIAAENPPAEGEYRVFNQFDDTFSIMDIAQKVKDAGSEVGIDVTWKNIENPRVEMEEHYYNP